MANYYELTKSVRITNAGPIDGDRYIAADLDARNELITKSRAHVGLQVYVLDSDGSGTPQLYILTLLGTIITSVWDTISLKDGVKKFIELDDTPADWSTAQDGSIVTVAPDGASKKLVFTDALSAFNKDFGATVDMAGGDTPTGTDNKANDAGAIGSDKIAKIDHHHDGRYYLKTTVDDKIAAVNAGIKYIWDDKTEIDAEAPGGGYQDGEQGLLKDSTTGTTTSVTCTGAWESDTVYQFDLTNTCWKALYGVGGGGAGFADEVETHSGAYNDKSIIVSEAIGQYTAGEKIPSDDNVYNILKKILEKVLPPTAAGAAITQSFTGVSGVVEIGTDLAGLFSPSVNRGTVSSYDPADLPNKVNVIQVGDINGAVSTLSGATGGYTITGLSVSGAAQEGSNKVNSSFGTFVEAAPIYDSAGTLYSSSSIPRSLTKTFTTTTTGYSYMAYGTKFSSGATTPPFPNNRTTVLAENNKGLIGASMAAIDTVLVQNTDAAGFTWIFVTLKGTYTVAEARAKVRVYDKGTNDQMLDTPTTQVATFNMVDAGGTNSMPYTTIYRDTGNWTANKDVTITIL